MSIELSNLKEELKNRAFYDLALAIVKYQKFRTSAVIDKINFNGKPSTKLSYFNLGISYIKDKVRRRNVPSSLYNYIDELIEKHVQPLTPSAEDERCSYTRNYTRKTAVPPVARLDIVNKPVLEKYDMYGIKLPNGHIIPCKNDDYTAGYMAALIDNNIDTNNYKKILLKVSEV